MDYSVHMTAFGSKDEIRTVSVPDIELEGIDDDAILDLVFKYGQNMFQSRPHPSVSVGDVIKLRENDYWMVAPCGFKQMTIEQFEACGDKVGHDPFWGPEKIFARDEA